MPQKLHSWIKSVIDRTPGLTQKGLAEAMDLNPAAVNRMLYGARKIKFDELPIIEAYLGCKYSGASNQERDYLPPYSEIYGSSGGTLRESRPVFEHPPAQDDIIPVYGRVGDHDTAEFDIDNDEPVDWVFRHPQQRGIRDAFAVYVFSDDMTPRYFAGELVYIHPTRPPEHNKDCLVRLKDGTGFIRRYLGRDQDRIRLKQYDPEKEISLDMAEVKAMYTVVGRG